MILAKQVLLEYHSLDPDYGGFRKEYVMKKYAAWLRAGWWGLTLPLP